MAAAPEIHTITESQITGWIQDLAVEVITKGDKRGATLATPDAFSLTSGLGVSEFVADVVTRVFQGQTQESGAEPVEDGALGYRRSLRYTREADVPMREGTTQRRGMVTSIVGDMSVSIGVNINGDRVEPYLIEASLADGSRVWFGKQDPDNGQRHLFGTRFPRLIRSDGEHLSLP